MGCHFLHVGHILHVDLGSYPLLHLFHCGGPVLTGRPKKLPPSPPPLGLTDQHPPTGRLKDPGQATWAPPDPTGPPHLPAPMAPDLLISLKTSTFTCSFPPLNKNNFVLSFTFNCFNTLKKCAWKWEKCAKTLQGEEVKTKQSYIIMSKNTVLNFAVHDECK